MPKWRKYDVDVDIGNIDLRTTFGANVEGNIVMWVPKEKRLIVGITNNTDNKAEIWISDDFGVNWTIVYQDALPVTSGQYWRDTFVARNGTLLIGGSHYNIYSKDDGKTWARLGDLGDFPMMNFTEDKNGNLYACSHGPAINKSTNGGDNWTTAWSIGTWDEHLHGCYYDKWNDKFWLTMGDINKYIMKYDNTLTSREGLFQISYRGGINQYIACIVTDNALYFTTDMATPTLITRAYTDMSDYNHWVMPSQVGPVVSNIYSATAMGDLFTVWGTDYPYFSFSYDGGETWCYLQIGDDKTVEWAFDAGNFVLIITETSLVSISKESLRNMKPANHQIINIDYVTAGSTTYSMKVPIRKWNSIMVYTETDGTCGFEPYIYYYGNEYIVDSTISHSGTERKLTDLTAKAKGAQYINFRYFASSYKRMAVVILSDPV